MARKTNRRADSSSFGMDFQANAGIVIMLDYIEEMDSIRLESNYEDIEIKLVNGNSVLAQAKAVVKASEDFNNVTTNLKDSLASLSDAYNLTEAERLIFVTNSPKPIGNNKYAHIFFGSSYRSYNDLPKYYQKTITKYLSKIQYPLDKNILAIQVIPFETDDLKERYKVVRTEVEDFIGKLDLSIQGIGQSVLETWQLKVFQSGTIRNSDLCLSKKDIIWPIIVIITDINKSLDNLRDKFNEFDEADFEEVIYNYGSLINTSTERFESIVQVLKDYNQFVTDKPRSEMAWEFVNTQWEKYKTAFFKENFDEITTKNILKVILYQIIRNRLSIDKIKKQVNL